MGVLIMTKNEIRNNVVAELIEENVAIMIRESNKFDLWSVPHVVYITWQVKQLVDNIPNCEAVKIAERVRNGIMKHSRVNCYTLDGFTTLEIV
jgi:hypothetical protein